LWCERCSAENPGDFRFTCEACNLQLVEPRLPITPQDLEICKVPGKCTGSCSTSKDGNGWPVPVSAMANIYFKCFTCKQQAPAKVRNNVPEQGACLSTPPVLVTIRDGTYCFNIRCQMNDTVSQLKEIISKKLSISSQSFLLFTTSELDNNIKLVALKLASTSFLRVVRRGEVTPSQRGEESPSQERNFNQQIPQDAHCSIFCSVCNQVCTLKSSCGDCGGMVFLDREPKNHGDIFKPEFRKAQCPGCGAPGTKAVDAQLSFTCDQCTKRHY